MKELNSPSELESVFGEETAVLYKHSTTCPISAAAHRQMDALLERDPDAPLYKVDVHSAKELSDTIVEKTGIEHESPQLILLRGGSPTWSSDRGEITADGLAEQLRTPA